MNISVGSKNPVKIKAVIDTLKLYPEKFMDPVVKGIDISGENFDHPISIEQIISGATKRAKLSFIDCEYSIGLESGLIIAPNTNTGYMEISCAAVFDGKNYKFGLSSGYEWPADITKFITDKKGDGSLAYRELGYSESSKKGAEPGGIIAVLTKNRMTRENQIRDSIIMALI